jgi:delta 1-pyrroline-5-carboxylate dehydrogenase
MGGLLSGNKIMVKGDSRVSIVTEQLVSDLLECGLDPHSIELVHADKENAGLLMQEMKSVLRAVQFTGSSRVAELLMETFSGKVRIEDR